MHNTPDGISSALFMTRLVSDRLLLIFSYAPHPRRCIQSAVFTKGRLVWNSVFLVTAFTGLSAQNCWVPLRQRRHVHSLDGRIGVYPSISPRWLSGKASTSGGNETGIEPRFTRSNHTGDLEIDTLVHHRVHGTLKSCDGLRASVTARAISVGVSHS